MIIEFKDIGVDAKSTLGMTAVEPGATSLLTFQMPDGFAPANDLIGLAITTLVGQKYDQISIDLPMADSTIRSIETVTKAAVKAPRQSAAPAPTWERYALNFSGGFDSLAALTLLPENTALASLDFGGSFQREADFFSSFDTTAIRTNFRDAGFAGNTWQFMGIGTLLLRDYLEIGAYSFGSILEASPWNLKTRTHGNYPQPVFAAAGMRQVNPAVGLTEIGTVMLLVKYCPDLVLASLRSLAAPGSEKLNRKIMLLNIVQKLVNADIGLSAQQDALTPHFAFGRSLATDFLTLYILKKEGMGQAGQLVSGIPETVADFVQSRSLTFYERLNTLFANPLQRTDRDRVYAKCLEAGILPYSELDWIEYRETVAFLSQWHPGLK